MPRKFSPGDFLPTFASIALMRAAWKPVPRVRLCGRNLAEYTFSRTFAMAADIVWCAAPSALSNAGQTTAGRSNAHSATTGKKKGLHLLARQRARPNPSNLEKLITCDRRLASEFATSKEKASMTL